MTTPTLPGGATSVTVVQLGRECVQLAVLRSPPRFTDSTVCREPDCTHDPCRTRVCGVDGCHDDMCTHAVVLWDGPMTLANAFPLTMPGAARLTLDLLLVVLAAADPLTRLRLSAQVQQILHESAGFGSSQRGAAAPRAPAL